MKDSQGSQNWLALCEMASQEQDPKKLLDLISKINQALDEWNRSRADRAGIKSVVLPAQMLDEPKLDLPGAYVPLTLPLEYDC